MSTADISNAIDLSGDPRSGAALASDGDLALLRQYCKEPGRVGASAAMLGEIWFQYNLWKLQREQRKDQELHRRKISEAERANKPREVIDELLWEGRTERDLINDDIRFLVTRRILDQLDRYLLPRPELKQQGGMWEESRTHAGRYYLTPDAILELRALIRKEQKERHELWLPWVGGITGVIGALTGLLAVISSM